MVDKEKNVSWKISRRDDSVRQPPSNRGDTLPLFLPLSLRLASSNANTDISTQFNKREIFYNFYQP